MTDEPIDAEFVEAEDTTPAPRQVGISQPVFEFVTAFVGVAENIEPASRLQIAAQVRAMAKDLTSAVQRRSVKDVIHGTVGIAAMCLALFLSVTPHYQPAEGDADANGKEGGETGEKAEAQTGTETEGEAGTVLN
jgi:hypothetical protein